MLGRFSFLVLVLLLPWAFLPDLTSPWTLAKAWVFVAAGLFLVLSLLLEGLVKGIKSVSLGLPDGAFFLFWGLLWISAFLSPEKASTLLGEEGRFVNSIFVFLAFYFLYRGFLVFFSYKGEKGRPSFLWPLALFALSILGTVLFSLLLSATTVASSLPFLGSLPFSSLGGRLAILGLLLPLCALLFLFGRRLLHRKRFLVYLTAFVFLAFSVWVFGEKGFEGAGGEFPSLSLFSTWRVTVLALVERPFFGLGPSTFSTLATLFRPLELNGPVLYEKMGEARFFSPFSFYLEILGTVGLLGLGTLALLGFAFIRSALVFLRRSSDERKQGLVWVFLVSFLLWIAVHLFLPLSFPALLFLIILFGSITIISREENLSGERVFQIALPATLQKGALFMGAILWFAFSFLFLRFILSELKGSEASKEKDLTVRFSKRAEATELFPDRTLNQLAFSAVSLEAARALSTGGEALLKKAVEAVGSATQAMAKARELSPLSSGVWENTALLYRQLATQVAKADEATTQAYLRSISLEPTAPRLRTELGSYFLERNRNEEALDALKTAVGLKDDYAPAHFYLGNAFFVLGSKERGRAEVEKAIGLIGEKDPNRVLYLARLEAMSKEATVSATPKK